jgi:hypothetical protein
MAKLNEETAIARARDYLRANRFTGRVRDAPRAYLATSEEYSRMGLAEPTQWFVSFPRKLPPGTFMDGDSVCVIVDDNTGHCRILESL